MRITREAEQKEVMGGSSCWSMLVTLRGRGNQTGLELARESGRPDFGQEGQQREGPAHPSTMSMGNVRMTECNWRGAQSQPKSMFLGVSSQGLAGVNRE